MLNLLSGGQLLFERVESISKIITSFCVLLISFMSGVFVLSIGIKDSFFVRRYRSHGHMKDLVAYYLFTILSLFATHTIAIAALCSYFWFRVMIAAMLTNMLQVFFVVFVVYRLAHRIAGEASA